MSVLLKGWLQTTQVFIKTVFLMLAMIEAHSVMATEINQPPEKLDKMLVTANLVPTPSAQIGSAVTVITAQEIEQQQVTYVSEILRTVPGLAISQTGGSFGSLTQVRIRGAEGNHTLIRINGIEMNDPSNSSEYNLGNLLADNIERIEVIRGAQSALYGSDAIGGVINIITKKGHQGVHVNGSVEGGSFETYKVTGGVSGGWKEYADFAFDVSQLESDGISVSQSGPEKDANRNLTLNGNLNIRPLDYLELGMTGRFVNSTIETDGFAGGTGAVDADNETENKERQGRVFSKLTFFNELDWLSWEHQISAAYTESKRDNLNSQVLNSEFDGRKAKYDYQTSLFLDTPDYIQLTQSLTFLLEHEKDSVNASSAFINVDRSIKTTSYVGQYNVGILDRLFLSGSIRYDDNDDLFANQTTYRATLSYQLKETNSRLHASYGTGAKNPTLFELFGFTTTFQGNPNLQPEQSRSWDVGIEQNFFADRVSLDVTYYNNRIDNLITGSGLTAVNQPGKSHIEGIEFASRVNLAEGLDFTGSYTWNSTQDTNGIRLVRRAEHIASANLNYNFIVLGNKGNVNVGVKYNGKQTDFAFDPFFNRSTVVLDDYTLLNVAASYEVYDRVDLFVRVENLLDESYQNVFSYASRGIAGYAGIRIALGPFLK